MAKSSEKAFDAEQLLQEYQTYDRAVDLVSIYQWLFTGTKELPPSVVHFERYPSLSGTDGNKATPDFTVQYCDGTGLVGEIANVALHENSVDKLCAQIQRYDEFSELPGANGLSGASIVDVLVLTPISIVADVCTRICQRIDDPEHWYAPKRRPVIVGYSPATDQYTLVVWPSPGNGQLHPVIGAQKSYADFGTLNVKPVFFQDVKITDPFMNDPIPALYLATRLWVSVFPSLYGARGTEFTVSSVDIAKNLKRMYGRGNVSDVDRAMAVLQRAGLATQPSPKRWHVRRIGLRSADVHVEIAERIRPTEPRHSISPSKPALHNRGCSWGLNPPASSRDLAM